MTINTFPIATVTVNLDEIVRFVGVYDSRAEAEAATVPDDVRLIHTFQNNHLLSFTKDDSGTALTTDDGATWSPAGDVYVDHFDENLITGTTDMSYALQTAWDYANTNKTKVFMMGKTYYLSATVTPADDTWLEGVKGSTAIIRDTGFGDTFYRNGQQVNIRGIRFYHGTYTSQLDPAVVTSLDYRVTDGSAHLNLSGCNGVTIIDCEFYRMPYGVKLDGVNRIKMENNILAGTWHPTITDLQESVASVWFGGDATDYNQLASIYNNRFVGSLDPNSTARTFTDGTESETISKQWGYGPKYNVLVNNLEMMEMHGNYFNRATEKAVLVDSDAAFPMYGLNWSGNRFDAGFGQEVSGSDTQVVIIDNSGTMTTRGFKMSDFYYAAGKVVHGLEIQTHGVDAGEPSAMNIQIESEFSGHIGSPVLLNGARGVKVGGVISGSNWYGWADNDPTYSAGVYIGADSSHVHIDALVGGGNVNFSETDMHWSAYLEDPTDTTFWISEGSAKIVPHNSDFGRRITSGDESHIKNWDGTMEVEGIATLARVSADRMQKAVVFNESFLTLTEPLTQVTQVGTVTGGASVLDEMEHMPPVCPAVNATQLTIDKWRVTGSVGTFVTDNVCDVHYVVKGVWK